MQNEELAKASERAEQISEKYITLTKEGEITEANYSAYNLLEKKQTKLVGSRFGFFVTEKSKPVFNQFIEDVIKRKETETCMIDLNIHEKQDAHVLLTGHITRDGEFYMVAIIDITDFVANEGKIKQLEYFNSMFVDRELKMI